MKANEILEIIRGSIRPFITVTGWTTVLGAFIYVIIRFIDATLARDVIVGVLIMITAAVNYWLGSRGPGRGQPTGGQ